MNRKLIYNQIGDLMVHKDIGVGMTLKSLEGHWQKKTLLQKLIARKIKAKEVEEEERVLYVALTRARDFLYLIGTVDTEESYIKKNEGCVRKNTTYLDMIAPYADAMLVSPDESFIENLKKKTVALDYSKKKHTRDEITSEERAEIESRLLKKGNS